MAQPPRLRPQSSGYKNGKKILIPELRLKQAQARSLVRGSTSTTTVMEERIVILYRPICLCENQLPTPAEQQRRPAVHRRPYDE
jgi:hypothetical protein